MHRAGLETMLMNYYRNMNRDEIQFDFLTHRPYKSDYDDEILSLGGKMYYAPRLYPQNYLNYFKWMKDFFAKHGMKRYIKFFTLALKTVMSAQQYEGKTVLCWQQFYGIAIAFFCRLFHMKKKYQLVIMTFIYKQKKGLAGRLFYHFVKYAITSPYVDKIILTTQSERKKYQEIFGVDEAMFGFAKCGAIEYQPEEFDDNELKKKNYLFSTGRSNRDYSFLMQAIEGTEYQLIIACDTLDAETHDNIEVRKNTFGQEMLRYMRNAKAVVIALDDDTIAAGQLVLLHAMNMGVPVIITRSNGVTDDYVIDHYNGLIIEKTKEALLEALALIFHDDDLYDQLCENGQKEFDDNALYSCNNFFASTICNLAYEYLHIVSVSPETG